MSLLMDALKKAELAKRKIEADNALPVPAPAEPPSLPPSTEKLVSESIALEPQLLDDGFPAQPVESDPHQIGTPDDMLSMQEIGVAQERRRHKRQILPPSAVSESADSAKDDVTDQRAAIRNLFETKLQPSSRKSFAVAIGLIAILALAGIGGYFWYELQPKSSLIAVANLNANRPPPKPDIPVATPQPPAVSEPAIPTPEIFSESPDKGKTQPARDMAETLIAKPPAVAPVKKLFQLSKAAAAQTDPAVESGYSALNRGDTVAAKTAYEQALGNDPHNIDALSGLAVLAQRAGNPDQAADYFLRVIETDPHNAFALAGLIGLRPQMNPAEAEIRLKQALSAQPDSAPLNFSLGNLCAAARRWTEAQQAYFKAMTADPGNPDYLFNLAVSLDQLRQPRLAANYYSQAIAAVAGRSASFDQARASERLRQLQQ